MGPPSPAPDYLQVNSAPLATIISTGTQNFQATLHGQLTNGDFSTLAGWLETDYDEEIGYLEGEATEEYGIVNESGTFSEDLGDTSPTMWIQKAFMLGDPPPEVPIFDSNSYYRVQPLQGVGGN
ncbi:hypothetical protein BMS3Bbin04_00783 [bacterium BMS3Bbin04]|nr:hypothetical protein BMS3Bbin04_00783 [bacterium BMS3Bbin04]